MNTMVVFFTQTKLDNQTHINKSLGKKFPANICNLQMCAVFNDFLILPAIIITVLVWFTPPSSSTTATAPTTCGLPATFWTSGWIAANPGFLGRHFGGIECCILWPTLRIFIVIYFAFLEKRSLRVAERILTSGTGCEASSDLGADCFSLAWSPLRAPRFDWDLSASPIGLHPGPSLSEKRQGSICKHFS